MTTLHQRLFNNIEGGSMNNVTVNKAKLLEAMRANLEKHRDELQTLLSLRRSAVMDWAQQILTDMKDKPEYQPTIKDFPMPPDKSKEYERAIKMTEMSVNENIQLSSHEFDQFVLDEWSWKEVLKQSWLLYSDDKK